MLIHIHETSVCAKHHEAAFNTVSNFKYHFFLTKYHITAFKSRFIITLVLGRCNNRRSIYLVRTVHPSKLPPIGCVWMYVCMQVYLYVFDCPQAYHKCYWSDWFFVDIVLSSLAIWSGFRIFRSSVKTLRRTSNYAKKIHQHTVQWHGELSRMDIKQDGCSMKGGGGKWV